MQVTITIRTLEQKFPGGTVGGVWCIEAALASDPATLVFDYDGAAPSTTFDMDENETYIIRGLRRDAGDNILGPIATTQYTVGEDLAPIDVAGSISAVSSPGVPATTKGKK